MSETPNRGSQQHSAGSQGRSQSVGGSQEGQGKSDSLYDQAQGAVREVANSASEMWDDATEQGERYYRQGSDAVRNIDSTTVGVLLVAGAIGYGVSWLIHGQQSYSGQRGTGSRQMAQRSNRGEQNQQGRSGNRHR